jgi:hypothetical protein
VGWVPFRASDVAGTLQTLRGLVGPVDTAFWAAHRALVVVPLGCLAFCLADRDQRVQDWLVARAGRTAIVATGAACLVALEVFAPIDGNIPFLYFKF